MKKDYEGTAWTENLIKLHQSIDWEARDYEPYLVDGTEIRMPVTLIDKGGVAKAYATFALELSANSIYEPRYVTKEFQPFEGYLSGCYDGHKVGPYRVMDRFETYEIYDMLSK